MKNTNKMLSLEEMAKRDKKIVKDSSFKACGDKYKVKLNNTTTYYFKTLKKAETFKAENNIKSKILKLYSNKFYITE